MSTKRLLNITPALALLFTVLLSANASAAYYQQHQSNPAMIETLEEAHANAPAYLANEYGRIYVPDPALDMYPQGTTYVSNSNSTSVLRSGFACCERISSPERSAPEVSP